MTIKLYTWATPNGRKVSILLEELELDYVVVAIDITADAQFAPDFLALNPNHKIPVLVDPDGPEGAPITLSESGAILIYLAEKTRRFLPAGGAERYRALQWLMFQMGGVGPMFGQLHHFRRTPERHDYAFARFQNETRRIYGILDGHLAAARYLGGEEYGIADMATYPWIARNGWHDTDLAGLPNVARWFYEVGSRPAVRRGMNVPGPG
jgi:GST-like protein